MWANSNNSSFMHPLAFVSARCSSCPKLSSNQNSVLSYCHNCISHGPPFGSRIHPSSHLRLRLPTVSLYMLLPLPSAISACPPTHACAPRCSVAVPCHAVARFRFMASGLGVLRDQDVGVRDRRLVGNTNMCYDRVTGS